MPYKSPKGDVHAWNWLSHISVPCFCAVVASQTNSPIKYGSSCKSWENTLNFKHSMVTDTQARRIITVSNIDQVVFFLIMLTHCFFPATIQLAKCNVPMTRDTIDLAKPLQQKALFDPELWHETCVFLSLVQSIGYKKRHLGIRVPFPPIALIPLARIRTWSYKGYHGSRKMEKILWKCYQWIVFGLYLKIIKGKKKLKKSTRTELQYSLTSPTRIPLLRTVSNVPTKSPYIFIKKNLHNTDSL